MKISRERTMLFDGVYVPDIPEDTCAFNIVTDGYYWRTSDILQCDITFPENSEFTKITYIPEPGNVSDEYDILAETFSSLKGFSHIITFNGKSFAFPYLRNKSSAYELCYNIDEISTSDLYILFKSLYHLLGLPTRKLKDYLNFLEYKGNDDSAGIMKAFSLNSYMDFLNGMFIPDGALLSDGNAVFSFTLEHPVPKRISFPFYPFYLILDGQSGKLSAKVFDGSVRVYHDDYENYEYLINEGYAVHKSISGFIEKSKKRKAGKDDAYTYMKVTGQLLSDPDMQQRFLSYAVDRLNAVL